MNQFNSIVNASQVPSVSSNLRDRVKSEKTIIIKEVILDNGVKLTMNFEQFFEGGKLFEKMVCTQEVINIMKNNNCSQLLEESPLPQLCYGSDVEESTTVPIVEEPTAAPMPTPVQTSGFELEESFGALSLEAKPEPEIKQGPKSFSLVPESERKKPTSFSLVSSSAKKPVPEVKPNNESFGFFKLATSASRKPATVKKQLSLDDIIDSINNSLEKSDFPIDSYHWYNIRHDDKVLVRIFHITNGFDMNPKMSYMCDVDDVPLNANIIKH